MLYPQSKTKALDEELFQNPTKEYRGTPFWSWNCKLDKETLREQMQIFKQMGFGGFHIHPRTGLATQYMSDEYLDCVRFCKEYAKENEMLCWLYDEDRYPSGAAGGLVTCELQYRARHLLLSRRRYDIYEPDKASFDSRIARGEKPQGYYLASYLVQLENGCLKKYTRCEETACVQECDLWHAYLVLAEESPWFNDQTYVDVLNADAIRRFIQVTHERYYQTLGEDFGKTVPAIFTDEPQISGKSTLPFAESGKDVTMSYTDDISDTYCRQYGTPLLDVLPEIFWELPGGEKSIVRYQYHDHLSERFVSAFSDTLGAWCEEHQIALTGHFMSERTLYSQMLALGEAMRCYRSFQLPGIDILCDAKEFSTAKQAVSVARQYGREGAVSELYGVTHWYHDFKGHKLQGDWQAALGITVRVHHLAFMSMEGEAKRDWPASISYQSPWYREYPYIEDHFARLNTVLTRGKSEVRVAVIHPMESFWLDYGPNDQTQTVRDQCDADFENMICWMLYGMIDFDFISESLLPQQCLAAKNPLPVGEMEYNTIVVPNCLTIRASTLERLEVFHAQGGKVIFAGSVPTLVDARPSDRAVKLAKSCETIPFNRNAVLDALQKERSVEVRQANGRLSDNLIYQMRQDGKDKWLFLCHVNRKRNRIEVPEKYTITIKGCFRPVLYDTLTGSISPAPAVLHNGYTVLEREMYAEDSLLFKLEPGVPDAVPEKKQETAEISAFLPEPQGYSLSEPNVLLLDYAEYAFNDGEYQQEEYILRIDNQFRDVIGYPQRKDSHTQPWRIANEIPKNVLRLRYRIDSKIEVSGAKLAMERPQNARIALNGELVDGTPNGWFVDKFIQTVTLPALRVGENILTMEIPFTRKTDIECCYLLGEFGVRVCGRHSVIEKLPEKIYYGDWVPQGLPFYAGNLTYECKLKAENEIPDAILEVPHFSSPVLAAAVDEKSVGLIAFAPHKISLGTLAKGEHTIKITVYGNRYNSFGTLHNANDEYKWYGPDSYRTTGSQWSDPYILYKMGILSPPVLHRK